MEKHGPGPGPGPEPVQIRLDNNSCKVVGPLQRDITRTIRSIITKKIRRCDGMV